MGILWESSFWTFFFVTVVIGGGAGFLAGRALASKWRPIPHLIFFMLLLGLTVRFFHYALFEETLLSIHYYAVDTLILIGISLLGYRLKRVSQMISQYRWLYVRSGPFTWREK